MAVLLTVVGCSVLPALLACLPLKVVVVLPSDGLERKGKQERQEGVATSCGAGAGAACAFRLSSSPARPLLVSSFSPPFSAQVYPALAKSTPCSLHCSEGIATVGKVWFHCGPSAPPHSEDSSYLAQHQGRSWQKQQWRHLLHLRSKWNLQHLRHQQSLRHGQACRSA